MRSVTQAGLLRPVPYSQKLPTFGAGDLPEQPKPSTTPATSGLSKWSPLDALRLKMAKPVHMPAATGVLNRVAAELVAANGIPQPITVYVVNQPSYNARALSNGVVMVHSGLLKQVISPEEVAFVLAHEISHRQLKHHEHHDFEIGAAGVGGVSIGYAMRRMLALGLNGKVGRAASVALRLAAWILPIQGLSKQHRDQEMQADLNAVRLLINAGYSPLGYQTLMTRMTSGEENRSFVNNAFTSLLGRSHPPVIVRKTALAQRIQAEPVEKLNASRSIMSSEEWRALKQAVGSVDDD